MLEQVLLELTEAINRLSENIEKSNLISIPEFQPETHMAENTKAEVKEEKAVEEKKVDVISFQQVRALLGKLSKDGKKDQVKQLLNDFGAAKLSDVKEEDYPAVMEKAGAL